MPIDSISANSSIMSPSAISRMSRPPETTPSAREAAAQENEPRRTAEAVQGAAPATLAGPDELNNTVGTRLNVVPASNDNGSMIQQAESQVSRAYAGGQPTSAEMRAASEAYQTETAAATQMAQQQQQQGGVRTTDVLA
jgi:hypothetical protein